MTSILTPDRTNDFQDLKDTIKIDRDINKSLITSVKEDQIFSIE